MRPGSSLPDSSLGPFRLVAAVLLFLAVLASLWSAEPAAAAGFPFVVVDATPKGWEPVDFEDMQISVPQSWAVLTGGEEACGDATGVLILGQGTWCPANLGPAAAPTTSIVTVAASRSPLTARHPRALVVNGLAVYAPDVTPAYLIPALGIELDFSGPPEPRVLHSVTYSPRAVALAPGHASTPRGWHAVTFEGIEVAVPRVWTVTRSAHAPACESSVVVSHPGLTLTSGPELPFSCAPSPLRAPAPVAGVEIDGFPPIETVSPLPSPTSCLSPRRINDLTVCVDPQPSFGELVLEVMMSGTRTITVRIGMFGSGRAGRAILDSLHRS